MIRGTKRKMQPDAARKLELRASIHNRFDVELLDASTGEVKQRARGFNVICNALWTQLLGGYYPDYFRNILIGNGSGTPAATDTTLFSQLGYLSVNRSSPGMSFEYKRADGIFSAQAVVTLQAEQYVGETLTEIGIGYDTTHCVTHALLEDMNGNPISITKTALDVVRIYATIFVHWPAGGWYGGSINLNQDAGNYHFLRYLCGSPAGSSSYSLYRFEFAGASRQTGSYSGPAIEAAPTYDLASKKISFAVRVPAGDQNKPIRSILIATILSGSNYKALFWITPGSWFNPPQISGEAAGTGDGSETGFATAFPVKTAGTVYVNGTAASGVTMRAGPANAAGIEQWWNELSAKSASEGALSSAGTPLYADSSRVSSFGIQMIGMVPGAYTNAFENPFFSLGVGKVQLKSNGYSTNTVTVQASADCQSWDTVGTITSTGPDFVDMNVPAAHQNKKYWRFYNATGSNVNAYAAAVAAVADTAHNIVFSSPPAAGAVITCDYVPDCIAKDENHVFDLSMELTLGEYQEA